MYANTGIMSNPLTMLSIVFLLLFFLFLILGGLRENAQKDSKGMLLSCAMVLCLIASIVAIVVSSESIDQRKTTNIESKYEGQVVAKKNDKVIMAWTSEGVTSEYTFIEKDNEPFLLVSDESSLNANDFLRD